MEIDINKKLQDQANEIMGRAIIQCGEDLNDPKLKELLNGIIVMSLKQGFIWGVQTIKRTTEVLMKNIDGE